MVLESAMHAGSSFVTLTYDDKNIPEGGTLVPKHAQDWLKRLRRALSPNKIRYFLVGEYGEKTWRPHHHAAIFGLSPEVAGGSDGMSGVVKQTWPYGFTYSGELNQASASYIAGYVTKKLTTPDNEKNISWRKKAGLLLDGRHPEFARMSLGTHDKRGGIGAVSIPVIADAASSGPALDKILSSGDVPSILRTAGKMHYIGRYLKQKLRKEMGYGNELKENAILYTSQRMCELYKKDVEMAKKEGKKLIDFQLDRDSQIIKNLEAKFKIYQSSRGII